MRSNIRFYYDNEWDKYTVTSSTEHPNWPGSNSQQRWPSRSWRSRYGTNSGWGRFVVDATNNKLYYDEGGGQITITITPGVYNADTLAQEIENQLNASGVSGSCIYYAYYDDDDMDFVISTEPSCSFKLICTNTTNAIWDTIGFDTSADTGFDSIHGADYIRIHTEEWIKIDAGAGNTISWCAFFVVYSNVQATATLRIELSNDDFSNIPFALGLTKSTLKNQYTNIFSAIQTYRYARIYIVDVDNPNGYIEIGRAWGGCPFQPRIGFSPKYARGTKDPSLLNESEGGQISTIQKTQYDTRDYNFDLVTGETADTTADFEAMFADRGESKELVIVEMPTSSSSNEFITPENFTYYCHFAKFDFYKHLGGLAYKLKIRIQEER